MKNLKTLLTLSVLFTAHLGFSHGTDTLFTYNTLDGNRVQSKQFHVDSLKLDCRISFADSGHIRSVEYLKEERLEGVSSYFNPTTGNLISSKSFHLGLRDGFEVRYTREGVLTDSIFYKDDLKSGQHKTFYPSGVLKSVIPYIEDKQEGVTSSFYENGEKEMEIAYKNGRIHGGFKTFSSKGKLVSFYTYKKGKQIAQVYPRQ